MKAFAVMSIVMAWVENATQDDVITVEEATDLVRQVAEAVQTITGAKGVAVIIESKHMCMMMRGVEKQNSSMNTSVMLGAFRDSPATRSEFLTLMTHA